MPSSARSARRLKISLQNSFLTSTVTSDGRSMESARRRIGWFAIRPLLHQKGASAVGRPAIGVQIDEILGARQEPLVEAGAIRRPPE